MFPTTPDKFNLALLPTPFHLLSRLSQQIGSHRIWIKRDDLSESIASGNKIRKLEFIFAAAKAAGCDTIITCGGLQSNHCRATAALGARLGFKVHLVLRGIPESDADGNLLLDGLFGAKISFYPVKEYVQNLEQILLDTQRSYEKQGSRAWITPTGASDGVGIWGYIHACEELKRNFKQANIKPAHIVCATGSAGTQAGLTLGVKAFGIDAKVHGVAVCDDEKYFIDKVTQDINEWQLRYGQWPVAKQVDINVIADYIGPGYGMAEPKIYRLIERIAAQEGILLDPVYTGKAFFAMLNEIPAGRFGDSGDIVFIHTGGSFGVFPHKQHFLRES